MDIKICIICLVINFVLDGVRNQTKMFFNTAIGTMISSPKYAAVLLETAKSKDINVNFLHNLVEVNYHEKAAIFEATHPDGKKEKVKFNYDLLHVTPPMSAPKVLAPLGDANGFVDVDKETLQHKKYANVFALGDCSNCPTSKTAAAAAGQCGALFKNLKAVMDGEQPTAKVECEKKC